MRSSPHSISFRLFIHGLYLEDYNDSQLLGMHTYTCRSITSHHDADDADAADDARMSFFVQDFLGWEDGVVHNSHVETDCRVDLLQ